MTTFVTNPYLLGASSYNSGKLDRTARKKSNLYQSPCKTHTRSPVMIASENRPSDAQKSLWRSITQTNLDEANRVPISFSKPIPKYLNKGKLAIQIPSVFDGGKLSLKNGADGAPKLHVFEFKDDSALFTAKILDSDVYKDGKIQPALTISGINGLSLSEKFQALSRLAFQGYNLLNVSAYKYGENELILTSDTPSVKVFDLDGMKSGRNWWSGIDSFMALDKKSMTISSATHFATEKNKSGKESLINIHNGVSPFGSTVTLFRIDPNHDKNSNKAPNREIVATWPSDSIRQVHQLSVADEVTFKDGKVAGCAALVRGPFNINMSKMMNSSLALKDTMQWKKDAPTFVDLVNLETGDHFSFEAPTLYCFHQINAFQNEEKKLVIRIIAYNDPDKVLPAFDLESLRKVSIDDDTVTGGDITEMTIDLENDKCDTARNTILDGQGCPVKVEFPVVNPDYSGKQNNFTWAIRVSENNNTGICKINHDKKCLEAFHEEDGCYFSEPLFVSNPNGNEEDDGTICTIKRSSTNSYLTLFNARTLEVISEAQMPMTTALPLHGVFVPPQDILLNKKNV